MTLRLARGYFSIYSQLFDLFALAGAPTLQPFEFNGESNHG
jgi:hypothetical protein